MIRCTPENVRFVSAGLDHPEGLCFTADGAVVAGGESGQIYRIDPGTGKSRTIAQTGGFVLAYTFACTSVPSFLKLLQ